MPTIANLGVSFTAKTDKFSKSVKRVKSDISGLKTSLKNISIAAAGLGTVAAAGFGVMVKSGLDSIDKIGKLSKTYGIATKELATFRLAAELGGSSLDTFTRASKNVSKAVFDFVRLGKGEAADAFKELGISQAELKPIMNDNVALMGLIGDRLNQMDDGAIKTAVAVKILGGRANELLPALAGGTKQFEEYRKEAQLFGLTLSRDAVKGVENANDAMTRLGALFQGFRDQTVASLAPALQTAVDAIREKLLQLIEGQGGVRAFAQNVAKFIINGFRNAAIGALTAFENLKTGINAVIETIQTVIESVASMQEAAADALPEWSELGIGMETSALKARRMSKNLNELKLSVTNTSGAINTINSVADRLISTIDQSSDSVKEHEEKQKRLARAVEETKLEMQDQAQQQQSQLIPVTEEARKAIDDLSGSYDNLANRTEKAAKATEKKTQADEKSIGKTYRASKGGAAFSYAIAQANKEGLSGERRRKRVAYLSSELNRQFSSLGAHGTLRLASGGEIGPSGTGNQDTQEVRFFKRPDETVRVTTPEQERSQNNNGGGMVVNIINHGVNDFDDFARKLKEWQRRNGPITNMLTEQGG